MLILKIQKRATLKAEKLENGAYFLHIPDSEQVRNIGENEIEKDIFSIKLQTVSYNFLLTPWHSLPKEEKFIFYDLAEDGLVNTYNRFALNILINKGLIVRRNGLLHIFNKSFRNFILTSIGDSEISSIKKQFKENSTWSKLRTVHLGYSCNSRFHIWFTEGAFIKTIGYTTLFAGSVPALIQILSLFNRTGANQYIPIELFFAAIDPLCR